MNTVFVGLSGGVDSAVSAALLKEQGCDVVGCFIKIWQAEFIECASAEDRLDALRVCVTLGIPFREIDLSEEYKQGVIQDMVQGYARGITPNPDVLCNSVIKFGAFARWAQSNGAEMVATGHYARVLQGVNGPELHRGVDSEKDQSYFLWQMKREDLQNTLFPVGQLLKSEVRRKAARLQLPVARKADSQGLCFVGNITIPEFLSNYISTSPGDVVDERGEVIGEHDGVPFYTIGQRHGFTIHQSRGEIFYCIGKDTASNTLIVSEDREKALRTEVRLRDVNWIAEPHTGAEFEAVARYRSLPVRARMSKNGGILFSRPVLVAPGQSVVLYDSSRVQGGGIAI